MEIHRNGHTVQKDFQHEESHPEKGERLGKESFEEVPLYTAVMTYLGFYILMILGYINQLFFTPKVATERHRDVSIFKLNIHSVNKKKAKSKIDTFY